MNAILPPLADQTETAFLIDRFGMTLLHSLWQFLVIGMLTYAVTQFMRRTAASGRYWVLTASMTLIAAVPMVTWFRLAAEGDRVADARVLPETIDFPIGTVDDETPASIRTGLPDVSAGQGTGQANLEQPEDAQPPSKTAIQAFTEPTELEQWLPRIVGLWACGVLLFSLRLLLSWYIVQRLKTVGVSEVNHDLLGVLQRLQDRLGLRREVRLLESTQVVGPIVVGFFRSVILLPASLSSGLPAAQLEAILAHELAHVRRFDYVVNLGQTLVETLFFYHPVVWWLSHRMRIEREHCCDDVAVEVLQDRVQYGRALLAIEEHRGIAKTLALGMNDGSLKARVQRLMAQEPGRNRGTSFSALVSLCLAGVMITVMSFAAGESLPANPPTQDDSTAWGQPSHGLRIRVLVGEGEFQNSDEWTLHVEVENVSDQVVSLVGFGDQENKNVITEFTPFSFQLDIRDRDGKPIPRTKRELFEAWQLLNSSTSARDLQPGEIAALQIQPGRFRRPMNYELPAGEYRLRVRYRGPTAEVKNEAAKYLHRDPFRAVWSHVALSNQVSIHIAEDLREPRQLTWGDEVNGLRAAVELRADSSLSGSPHRPPGIPLGTAVSAVLHLQNVTEKPITLVSETGRQGDRVHVTDADGQRVPIRDVFFTGWPIDVAWTILPGESAELDVLTPTIGALEKPGRYQVRYTIRFDSRVSLDDQGQRTFPRPEDYFSVIDTGEATLLIADRQRASATKLPEKEDSPAVAPENTSQAFRLPDHWIVEDLRWLPDDQQLVTVSLQGGVNVRRWNVATRELRSEIKLTSDRHGRPVKQGTLRLSADGRRVFAVTDEYVGVWDAIHGNLLRQLPIPKKEWEYDTVGCLDCSADGSIVVAGLTTHFTRLTLVYNSYGIAWNANTGQVLCRLEHKSGMDVCDVSVTPNGKYLVTCATGHRIGLWETSSGKLLQDLSKFAHDWRSPDENIIKNNVVRDVALSADGRQLAISGTFGVRLIDVESGELHRTIEAPYRYNSGVVEFSHDGRQLARFGARRTSQSAESVLIWSTDSGEPLGEIITSANQVRFSSTADRIAVADSDFYEAVSVWPIAGGGTLGPLPAPPRTHRIDRIEENTHHRGKTAAEFADRWKPVWGGIQQGLQYGLAFTSTVHPTDSKDAANPMPLSVGERIRMVAFVRNASQQAIQIDFRPDMFGNPPQVTAAQGDPISLSKQNHLGRVAHYRTVLQAGEVFGPLYLNVGIGDNPAPHRQVWTPYWPAPQAGHYSVSHTVSIGAREPQAKPDVAKPDWKSTMLSSGTLPFEIAPDEADSRDNGAPPSANPLGTKES